MILNRVVITGMGIISSAGTDLISFTDTITSGKRALCLINDKRIAHFNAKYAGIITADIDNDPFVVQNKLVNADRFVKLAAIAADQAIISAGASEKLKTRTAGLVIGTCSGPMLTIEEQYKRELSGNLDFSREDYFKRQYYSASVLLGKQFGIQGPVLTVTTACSAFLAAVSTASDLIRLGLLDIVLVGGVDSFSTTTLAGFAGLKATHDEMCAPFSVPPGLNLGEGAGFVILERQCSDANDNKHVFGEILGYGLSNDAWHCSAPDPTGKGAAQSIFNAVKSSEIDIQEISFISAHGTGTIANDKAETKAIKRVFGDKALSVPVSSAKGAVGHCLGAAGAVETIASLVCAQKEVLPFNTGFTEPREGCTLNYVNNPGLQWKKDTVFLKNNFAFGGNNASIIIATSNKHKRHLNVEDDPVCISAAEVITSAGIGSAELNRCLNDNISSVRGKIIPCRGEIKCCEIGPLEHMAIDKRIDTRMERSAILTAIACTRALTAAGISERQTARMNLGLFMNIAQGSTWAEKDHITSLLTNNYELNQVNTFPFIVPNSVTGSVCRVLSLTGHNNTFCNGHGAGLTGLGLAWAALKNNHAQMLLCGCVDDLSERGLVDCALSNPQITSDLPLGEGAAAFLLEKLSHAKERGAQPLCVIRSFSLSNGLKNRESYCKMIQNALADAGITGKMVSTVCYNTWSNIADEAVKEVFGTQKYSVIDCTKVTGYAPASLPLFNISAVLSSTSFDSDSDKKYIVTFFNASQTTECVAVFEKIS